jgi:putative inorganic carbon (hco3(-)) transporter
MPSGQRTDSPSLRSVWRPPWYAWALLAISIIGLTYKLFPGRLEGKMLVLTPVVIVIGVLVLRKLWDLPPAITLCAALVLTIFSGGWSLIGLGGLPLNRLLMILVLLQFALRAPGISNVPRLRVRNVHILMALAVIYAVISATMAATLTTSDGFLTLTDVFGVVPFLVFLVAPAVFSGQRERNLLLATLVGLGLYLGVTALLEAFGPRALIFPSYIVHTDQSGAGATQVSGPFQSPVAEGFAVFSCAVASLVAFFQWRDRRSRLLAVLAGFLCLLACFATLERGVWIAAVVATVAGALLTRAGRRWLVPGALACVVGVGLVLAVSSQLSQQASERANYELSVWDRQNQTAAGMRMVAAKPLFGFGWDRYQTDNLEYFRQPADYPMAGQTPGVTIGLPQHVSPLHNTYLAYAVELGLVGWLLWLGSLLAAVATALAPGPAALRPWKLGLVPVFMFFFVVSVFDPHEQPFPMVLLLLWAGVALGNTLLLPQRGSRQAAMAVDSGDVYPVPA